MLFVGATTIDNDNDDTSPDVISVRGHIGGDIARTAVHCSDFPPKPQPSKHPPILLYVFIDAAQEKKESRFLYYLYLGRLYSGL